MKIFKDIVSVIDFGSSKITMLTGKEEVNKSFKLLSSVDIDYDGYSSGEFIEPNNLKNQIMQAINSTEKELQCKVGTLFVGVPAEFCFVTEKTLVKNFAKKVKITSKIINELFDCDDEINSYTTHSIINKSPMYFILNEDNRTNEPIGQFATKIQAVTSYVMVENNFKMQIGSILDSLGVKNYDFLSNTLSEAVGLLPEHKRNEGAILIDCGFISTSVCQVLGDGLKELKCFSMGGGYITADLSRILEISYDEAEELKTQAIITQKSVGMDFYELQNGKKFGIKNVNEIILARLDKITELIKKCLFEFKMELPSYIPLYFTGGGLNFFEGITDYLRKEYDRPIEMIKPNAMLYARPDLSSSISLLGMAINMYK